MTKTHKPLWILSLVLCATVAAPACAASPSAGPAMGPGLDYLADSWTFDYLWSTRNDGIWDLVSGAYPDSAVDEALDTGSDALVAELPTSLAVGAASGASPARGERRIGAAALPVGAAVAALAAAGLGSSSGGGSLASGSASATAVLNIPPDEPPSPVTDSSSLVLACITVLPFIISRFRSRT